MSDVNQAVEETVKTKKPTSKKTASKKPAAKKAKGKKAPKAKKVAKGKVATKRVKAEVEVPTKFRGKKLSRLLNSVSGLESLDKKHETYAPWLYIARKAEKGTVTVEDYVRAKHDLDHLEALIKEGRVVAK